MHTWQKAQVREVWITEVWKFNHSSLYVLKHSWKEHKTPRKTRGPKSCIFRVKLTNSNIVGSLFYFFAVLFGCCFGGFFFLFVCFQLQQISTSVHFHTQTLCFLVRTLVCITESWQSMTETERREEFLIYPNINNLPLTSNIQLTWRKWTMYDYS